MEFSFTMPTDLRQCLKAASQRSRSVAEAAYGQTASDSRSAAMRTPHTRETRGCSTEAVACRECASGHRCKSARACCRCRSTSPATLIASSSRSCPTSRCARSLFLPRLFPSPFLYILDTPPLLLTSLRLLSPSPAPPGASLRARSRHQPRADGRGAVPGAQGATRRRGPG